MLRDFLRGFRRAPRKSALEIVLHQRDQLALLSDDELKAAPNSFAKAAVAAERVLGLRPYDEQILGAMAIAGPEGKGGAIAEMQTGEGKTLAAVLAVAEIAHHGPVHVLTANDYLAKRDAEWMRGVYQFLGLSVGHITHDLAPEDRRRAYQCDITYATPNEIGFDFLRDQLALQPEDLVHRPFRRRGDR